MKNIIIKKKIYIILILNLIHNFKNRYNNLVIIIELFEERK